MIVPHDPNDVKSSSSSGSSGSSINMEMIQNSSRDVQLWIQTMSKVYPQDPDIAYSAKKDKTLLLDPSKIDHAFSMNMQSRVPIHLVQIISLLPNQTSIHLKRVAVDCFCRCILVDTYLSWIETNDVSSDNEWIESAKEYILIMITDADGTFL